MTRRSDFAEAITLAYHRTHGVNTKIVRIFNTYGPRMRLRDGRAVPAFVSQALANQDVTVFGDGTQTRSFCYVTDLVRGILSLMDAKTNEPVNIGNPHEVTIEEIAQTIIRLIGSTSKIIYRPLPVDDPEATAPGHHPRANVAGMGTNRSAWKKASGRRSSISRRGRRKRRPPLSHSGFCENPSHDTRGFQSTNVPCGLSRHAHTCSS